MECGKSDMLKAYPPTWDVSEKLHWRNDVLYYACEVEGEFCVFAYDTILNTETLYITQKIESDSLEAIYCEDYIAIGTEDNLKVEDRVYSYLK